jgi:hypothetical protein
MRGTRGRSSASVGVTRTGRACPRTCQQSGSGRPRRRGKRTRSSTSECGVCYANGKGVPKDPRAAVAWYRQPAAQGHANAQYNLALHYYSGEGVPKDMSTAEEWLWKAAAQGHAGAQEALRDPELFPLRSSRTNSHARGGRWWASATGAAWSAKACRWTAKARASAWSACSWSACSPTARLASPASFDDGQNLELLGSGESGSGGGQGGGGDWLAGMAAGAGAEGDGAGKSGKKKNNGEKKKKKKT